MPFLTFLKFILTQFCLFSLLTFCQNEKLRASETVEMAVLEAQKWLKLISRKNWVEEKFLNFYTLSKIEFRYDRLSNLGKVLMYFFSYSDFTWNHFWILENVKNCHFDIFLLVLKWSKWQFFAISIRQYWFHVKSYWHK